MVRNYISNIMSKYNMWKLSIFMLLPSFAFLAPIQSSMETQARNEAVLKIAGGVDSVPGRWPWQALLVLVIEGQEGFSLCGGSLIHPEWVLTSFYCIRDYGTVDVIMGVWNISDVHEPGRTFYTSTRVVAHPCAEEDHLTGTDLALIQLSSPHDSDDVICLPNNYYGDWDDLVRGDDIHGCIATGFGRSDSNTLPSILQQVAFQNVSKHKCEMSYGSMVSNDKICAYGSQGQDTCDGDIGGPLVCGSSINRRKCGGRYLAAVTLAGSSDCGDSDFPGVYNAVFPHVDWIKSIINGTSDEQSKTGTTAGTRIYTCMSLAQDKISNPTDPAYLSVRDSTSINIFK